MDADRLSATLNILTRSYDQVEPERIVAVRRTPRCVRVPRSTTQMSILAHALTRVCTVVVLCRAPTPCSPTCDAVAAEDAAAVPGAVLLGEHSAQLRAPETRSPGHKPVVLRGVLGGRYRTRGTLAIARARIVTGRLSLSLGSLVWQPHAIMVHVVCCHCPLLVPPRRYESTVSAHSRCSVSKQARAVTSATHA